jgi:regulatory protein
MAGTITALVIQKKNKERVNLFLDDEYVMGISLDAALRLRKGQLLSESDLASLRTESDLELAFQQALRFLAPRPRSRGEVERKLAEKEWEPAVIAAVVARLSEQRYVDDEAFAQYWTENRNQFRPRSSSALRYELRQKGLDKDVIDESLAGADDEAAAWAALQPKLARWRTLDPRDFTAKATGFLGRRGFSYGIIRQVLKRAGSDAEAEDG